MPICEALQSATPSTPASGYVTWFINSSGQPQLVNSSGTVSNLGSGGSGGGGTWGSITGTLSAQSDLSSALALKAPLASPTFSGTVIVPAPVTSDNSTKAATTAYVQAQGYLTGINATQVTTALGYTPYSASNPAGYISTINSTEVTTALGFTPLSTTGTAANSAELGGVAASSYATTGWVTTQGYTTQAWVTSQNYETQAAAATIAANLTAEVARAEAAEALLLPAAWAASLYATQGELSYESAVRATLAANLTVEVCRAEAAEALLLPITTAASTYLTQTAASSTYESQSNATATFATFATISNLSAETAARATLAANLTAEVSRAEAAEGTLTANLNAEIATRSTLSANLTAEVARAEAAEATLTANLTSEITNRINAWYGLAENIAAKAPLASPAFTGSPTAPQPPYQDSTSNIATTAWVFGNAGYFSVANAGSLGGYSASLYAMLANPTFTGSPQAPTPVSTDNSTAIATTAFVNAKGYLAATTASGIFAPIASPTFTGSVTAPTFIGALTGNASSSSTSAACTGNAATATNAAQLGGIVAANYALLTSPNFLGNPSTTTANYGDITTRIANCAFVAQAVNTMQDIVESWANVTFISSTSPTLTGTPTAPTAAHGTNTTQLATTAFVIANAMTAASPAFTGTPTAPTATPGTNTTQLATTAFVATALAYQGTYFHVSSANIGSSPSVPAGYLNTLILIDNTVSSSGTIYLPASPTCFPGQIFHFNNQSNFTQTISATAGCSITGNFTTIQSVTVLEGNTLRIGSMTEGGMFMIC